MSRRRAAEKRQVLPDPIYNSVVLNKFINEVMVGGKKTIAKNVFINLNNLKHSLNCFLASCYEVFNKPESLQYFLSNQTHQYLVLFYKYLKNRDLALKNKHKKQKKTISVSSLDFYLFYITRCITCKFSS